MLLWVDISRLLTVSPEGDSPRLRLRIIVSIGRIDLYLTSTSLFLSVSTVGLSSISALSSRILDDLTVASDLDFLFKQGRGVVAAPHL